ncbi:MAG: pyridoxamine 5'-phosphate oxidase family protein [Solirubrobacterales bacterium]|nr:pyridoxamine 5'-phosphate oxidase family protein [Solirubrobacterales bacterium]
MNWSAFAEASPDLAELGRERFQRQELCMLGTLRRSGWPRISPCELDFVGDELLLGMMWQSPKARDLIRDDRCVLHSCTSDRMGTQGDFKLYGRARDQQDESVRDAYRAAIRARIDWEPSGPFHLFAIDVESVGFTVFGPRGYAMAWNPSQGTRRWSQRGE